jgi:hypothetical protein
MNDVWLRENITGRWHRVDHEHLRAGYTLSCDWPGVRYSMIFQTIKICISVVGLR